MPLARSEGHFFERASQGRAAKKVFLEFLKPFSSEKGFKPPEALGAAAPYSRRSRATPREARPLAERSDAIHAKKR